ncbi:hypothetical protein GC173_14650 [bacterium]|nr:hypothetical protein [bacterium]
MKKSDRVGMVFEPGVALSSAQPVLWAIGELEHHLLDLSMRLDRLKEESGDWDGATLIRLVSTDGPATETMTRLVGGGLPAAAESFAIAQSAGGGVREIHVYARDERGMAYAITELADRARYSGTPEDPFDLQAPIVESPAATVRSISKCFVSAVEDLEWFHSREGWTEYLSHLATHRFNRFALTLGMQYNYPYGNEFISDAYFHFAYPFLVAVPGHAVSVAGLADCEREKNLETLKFIGREARRRGLDFQLALWTQNYDHDDCPNSLHPIVGVRPETLGEYCRDALAKILAEVPEITGLTLRVHVECGIAEGDLDFWRTYFQAVAGCGRTVGLDLHAKGIDARMIELARATGMPVAISPKYTSEHMGLPYHQASIRALESPPRETAGVSGATIRGGLTLYTGDDEAKYAGKWGLSEGSRKFMRYSFGDLLREDRDYGILFRIWPGTQRILLWADPALAAGYGRNSTICGAAGVELCEPLSFKGRMGSGLPGGRQGYADASLATAQDWRKYELTYRVWGRSIYNPDSGDHAWRRYFSSVFGEAAEDCADAIAHASRILPFITLVHTPTASNNSYWPELYENMSIVNEAPHLPYGYELDKPARFGTVGACDPQLFLSPSDFARQLHRGGNIRKISPLTCANWLDRIATTALAGIASARERGSRDSAEFRRLSIDATIQGAIGKFFADKIRAAVLWELYRLDADPETASEAIALYARARDAWQLAADACRDVYQPDLTYGPHSWLRGRWDDRLPAIDRDIADMKAIAALPADAAGMAGPGAADALRRIRAWSSSQRTALEHTPPERFARNREIELSFDAAEQASAAATLHYRHVNQAEDWQSAPMRESDGRRIGAIPAAYTDTPYPLQYYFEVEEAGCSQLCPGLADDLSNQPYWIIRQRDRKAGINAA